MRWTALAVCLLVAGCSGAGKTATLDPGVVDPLVDPLAGNATNVPAAPTWQVGQYWNWEATVGDNLARWTSVVVADGGEGWTVATPERDAANREASFDHPLLGSFAKRDLSGTGWGGTWDLLDFPLEDGKEWQGFLPNIAFDTIEADQVQIDLRATGVAELRHAGASAPGFLVEGYANGVRILESDFVPAAGGFTRIVVYDVDSATDPDQDPIEVAWQVTGHGLGWTGSYHLNQGEPVLRLYDRVGFDNDPSQGGQPVAEASPYSTFRVPDTATTLYGTLRTFAVFGSRQAILLPPEGEPRHYDTTAPAGQAGTSLLIDEPALPGTWQFLTLGAGGHSGLEVALYAITETTLDLAPRPAAASPAPPVPGI